MPLINLIQEQRLLRKRQERKARTFFLLFAGSFVAAVAGYGLVAFENDRLENEESMLKVQAQRVTPLIQQAEANDRARAAMMPRLKTLEDAQSTSERWSRILAHLSTQVPPDTWLTAVRCSSSDPASPISITFQGLSESQDRVGEFILRLQNSADVQGVTLKFTQEKLINMAKATEFQLEAQLVGSGSEVSTEVEAKL